MSREKTICERFPTPCRSPETGKPDSVRILCHAPTDTPDLPKPTISIFAKQPREMDLSLTYRALASGQVDLIAGNSTDGLIAALDLFQLADDRKYFPPYQAVFIAAKIVWLFSMKRSNVTRGDFDR
jgi:hypothetical protein